MKKEKIKKEIVEYLVTEEFLEDFKVQNEDAALDGRLLDKPPVSNRGLWTVVEGDDGELYALQGRHFVNVIGYIIKKPTRKNSPKKT